MPPIILRFHCTYQDHIHLEAVQQQLTDGPGIHDDILESKAKIGDSIANHHVHCVELLRGKREPL